MASSLKYHLCWIRSIHVFNKIRLKAFKCDGRERCSLGSLDFPYLQNFLFSLSNISSDNHTYAVPVQDLWNKINIPHCAQTALRTICSDCQGNPSRKRIIGLTWRYKGKCFRAVDHQWTSTANRNWTCYWMNLSEDRTKAEAGADFLSLSRQKKIWTFYLLYQTRS